MKPGDLRWALATPVLAYAVILVLLESPPWSVTSAVVLIALAVPFLEIAPGRLERLGFVPAVLAAVAAVAVAASDPSDPSSVVGPYVVGFLLGGPLLFVAVTARVRGRLAGGIATVGGAIALATFLDAVARRLPGGAQPVAAVGWAHVTWSVAVDQAHAVSAFAAGTPIPPAPLGYVGDPVLDVLALVAFSGLLASFFFEGTPEPDGTAPWTVIGLPADRWPWGSFLAVVAALGVVETIAASDPGVALLAVVLGTAAATALVALLVRWSATGAPAPDTRP